MATAESDIASPKQASTAQDHIADDQMSPGKQEDPAQAKLQILSKTVAELKARRAALAISARETKGSKNNESGDVEQMENEAMQQAKATTQEHIRLLSQYNEIKDVATSLIGMLAENRQKRIIDIMEELGVEEDD